jgi:hypothetical protein
MSISDKINKLLSETTAATPKKPVGKSKIDYKAYELTFVRSGTDKQGKPILSYRGFTFGPDCLKYKAPKVLGELKGKKFYYTFATQEGFDLNLVKAWVDSHNIGGNFKLLTVSKKGYTVELIGQWILKQTMEYSANRFAINRTRDFKEFVYKLKMAYKEELAKDKADKTTDSKLSSTPTKKLTSTQIIKMMDAGEKIPVNPETLAVLVKRIKQLTAPKKVKPITK